MSVGLFTEQEGRAKVRDMIDSREWWIVPYVSPVATDMCMAIESKYYSGEASADSEAMMLGRPDLFAIMFFRKTRMSKAQLAKITSAAKGANDEQDILIAVDPNDPYAMERGMIFHNWVMGDDGWKPAAER